MESFLQPRSSTDSRTPATALLPTPVRASGFQSLLEAAPLLAAARRDHQRSFEPEVAATAMADEEPTVELVKENGRISRIIISCACCRTIELDCDYPA